MISDEQLKRMGNHPQFYKETFTIDAFRQMAEVATELLASRQSIEDLQKKLDAQETISEIQQLAIAHNKIRMEEANSLLRSAYQIANRNGEDTNWDAFKNSLEKELLESKGVEYPCDDEQLVLRATCTARTYRDFSGE